MGQEADRAHPSSHAKLGHHIWFRGDIDRIATGLLDDRVSKIEGGINSHGGTMVAVFDGIDKSFQVG